MPGLRSDGRACPLRCRRTGAETQHPANLPVEYREIATICAATDVEIGGRTVLGIADARTLHQGLGVRTEFRHWLKRRVTENPEFKADVDYDILPVKNDQQDSSGDWGGSNAIICRLTLNAAKRIAMAEHNEKGAMVRGYFIWCEDTLAKVVTDRPTCRIGLARTCATDWATFGLHKP